MNLATTMTDSERLQYVMGCDLADCVHADHPLGFQAPKAAVVGNSVIAFSDGVSRQNQEDVMDSVLFATLVANKAFNAERQTQDWYAKFNQTLTALGWTASHWSFSQYRATQSRFTLDEVGLQIVGSAIAATALPGPASAALLKIAADAVAALKEKKEPLRLFERQSKGHRGGNFRVAACSESPNGTANMVMGAVNFRVASSVTDVLFFEWKSAEVEIYKGEHSLALNTRVYSIVRNSVLEMLGNNAKAAVAEFEI